MLGLTTSLQTTNTIEIHIGIRKTKALVDTGSQITLASHTSFQKSEFSTLKLHTPDYDIIRGVSGNHLHVLGQIILQVQIGHKTFQTPVHVVKGLTHSVILGLDFLERHSVSLNVGNRTIKIAEADLSIPYESKKHFARTSSKIIIPVKHESIVPIKISR